ncbi:SDR family oxidoreductase [Streptomyces roseoviridis]|uniref:SDR family oxidoreductase n=1 Tax=Streptomyces roseoviridis TaxID=67361 RepID=A0ABV5QKQ2_9ACTN
MQPFLVTGGTGKLGRAVVRRLHDGHREIRVLSRRAQPPGTPASHRRVVGDLRTGQGLDAALRGVGTVVHCATTYGKEDITTTRNLIDAALRSGSDPHLVYVSVVGVDVIPVPYYRHKLEAERMIARSGLPWTVQRATQFHDLVASFFAWQRWSPLTLTLQRFRFQPIDVRDVADRLARLAVGDPAGRAPDIGGPRVRTMRELATAHNKAHGLRRRVVSLRVPGRIARGFTEGANLAPHHAIGTVTFDDFLVEQRKDNGT